MQAHVAIVTVPSITIAHIHQLLVYMGKIKQAVPDSGQTI